MKQLSRRQALDWCAKHIEEWPEFKPSIAPDGWEWSEVNVAGELILVSTFNTMFINRTGWFHHRTFSQPVFIPPIYVNCRIPMSPKFNNHVLLGLQYNGHHEPSGVTFSQMMGDLCRN